MYSPIQANGKLRRVRLNVKLQPKFDSLKRYETQ